MESLSANANSVAVSNSSSKNDEEVNHASNPEVNSSTSVVSIPPNIPRAAPEPAENLNVANITEVRDFGCKYCAKRFSNKQALGGHQNAHKTERSMEKVEQLRHNQLVYLGGPSYPVMDSPPTFPGPFYRAMINRPYQSQQPLHHGVHIGHYGRPMLPMVASPYTPRPLYPGWRVQMPRIPQCTAPPLHMPYNPGYAPIGMVSLSARPVSETPPDFTNLGLIPSRDPAGQNNNQTNNPENQEDENSELDLSLKL